MSREQLIEELEKIGISLSEFQYEQIDCFCSLLLTENKKYNLTAITKIEDVYLKHVYDSLTITKVLNLTQYNTLLDIGSGAGFPGIILRIAFPNLKITLLDSNSKKTGFLNLVKDHLQLEGLDIVNSRAEEFIKDHRESFDIVTARAVASLNILLELAVPFISLDGVFIAIKGKVENEIDLANEACPFLNCKIESIKSFELPIEKSTRSLVYVTKSDSTPNIYPRSYDKILKKPLKIIKK